MKRSKFGRTSCLLASIGTLWVSKPTLADDLPPSPSNLASHYDTQKGQAWLPFDRSPGGLIFLTVMLNDAPAYAMVDTGSSVVTLSRAYVEAHHLPLKSIGDAPTLGGMEHFDASVFQSLTVGGWSTTGGAISVTDLSVFSGAAGRPIDLVLGNSLLSVFAVQIDFDNRRLRLLPSGSRPIAGDDVPIALRQPGFRTTISVGITGQIFAPMMLDLGEPDELMLADASWQRLARTGLHIATNMQAYGLGGRVVDPITTIDGLTLGSKHIGSTQAEVDKGGSLAHEGYAGSIGLGMLSRYNLVIDNAAGRMTLAPRLTAEPPPLKSTVGIQFDALPDRLALTYIMTGSPAAASGLRIGDRICTVNGQHIDMSWYQEPKSHWTKAPFGTRYDLGLCNGRNIRLVTARFY